MIFLIIGMFVTFVCLFFSSRFFIQYVTEKMGGAEGTKLDLDFMDMERVSKSMPKSLSHIEINYAFTQINVSENKYKYIYSNVIFAEN